ncbi:MAG TPA: hypothetical protein VE623_11515 [Acidimicrobiales bacterium]|jgi:hypothetical protein|nr:hypothetical protein [Acidimicrobiales bacterium]
MRSTLSIGVVSCLGVAALTGVMALAGPAAGKGAVSATISGPGLDTPIEVTGAIDPDETGMWHALSHYPDPALLDAAPAGDLGPRHILTWQVISGQDHETGEHEATPIRQDLYLDAEGGPVAYTAPAQRFRDDVTVEVWYRVPDALRDTLAAAGVPLTGNKIASEGSAVPPPAPGPSGDPVWPAVAAGAGAGLALVGVGGTLAMRRVRRRSILTAVGVCTVSLAGAVGLAAPAAAKGLESVTIDGPGLAQAVVLSTRDDGTALVDDAGRPVNLETQLYADVVMGDTTAVDLMTEPPTDDHGPAYSVTWRLDITTPYEQQLYPFAAGGPLVQIYLDEFAMWYRVPDGVLGTLADLGVIAADGSGPKATTSGAPAKKAAAATPPAPAAAAPTGHPVWPTVAAGAGGGLALVGVGGALVIGRVRARRRRMAPIPL